MSNSQIIACPSCGQPVPIGDVLRSQVEQQLRTELDRSFQTKLATERKQAYAVAMAQVEAKNKTQLADLTSQLQDKQTQLDKAQDMELSLRKREREIEDKNRQLELTIERRLAQERESERQKVKKEVEDSIGLTLAQKDKQIEQMNKTISDLKRQSEQGSMQVQGDAAESSLKDLLTTEFPEDEVSDVATGVRGADLVQKVGKKLNQLAGLILWESKQTKEFSKAWLTKLKSDQQATKASLAVLVSAVVPDGIKGFGLIKGVWVCERSFALALARVLRTNLIELRRLENSMENRQEKTLALHQYLTSIEFKNHIENQVLTYLELKDGLDKERSAMTTIWNKREKQLQKFMTTTAGLYGDLQGIIGGALPSISQLELASPTQATLTSGKPESLFESTQT